MKTSTVLLCLVLALTAKAFADRAVAQSGASTTSSTGVTADRGGASATSSNASAASASTGHTSANATASSEMSATLSKPVDARKAKPGDLVTARNDRDAKSADGTSIHQGAKLVGHVSNAKPLDKSPSSGVGTSNQSTLSIVFDKAILKDGRVVPLNATIQAVAAAASDASLGSDVGGADVSTGGLVAGSARTGRGGLIGGVGGSVGGGLGAAGGLAGGVDRGVSGAAGGVAGATVHSAGAVGGLNSGGALTAGSKGVFGLNGLDIVSSSADSAEASVITSSTRNVRLDGGTKMLLSDRASTVGGSASASGATETPAPR